MTTTPDMSVILQDLASGRIDAAEAARRIDQLSARHNGEDTSSPDEPRGSEPSDDDLRRATAAGDTETDAWARETDRPQQPTHRRDSFRTPEADARAGGTTRPGRAGSGRSDAGRDEPGREQAGEKPRIRVGGQNGVTRISVRAIGRRVRIVGETSVSTLSADGPHVLRRNGSVLEVSSDGEMGASLDGFSILRAPRSLDDIRSLGLGKELLLKVNPSIVVDVEVTAGSLNTERVPYLGKVRVTAGSAKLLDVAEINDALVQAGSATVKGAITTGRSRIRAESGSLTVHLADHSDVTVTGEAQLGKVSWAGGHTGSGDEVVMGNGKAKLDIEVVMGHAQIRVGSDVQAGAV